MMLKKQLEILHGKPLSVFTGNPMKIPCIETSDAEKLCKHPVVSVEMITYNHEPYIRQAIEGVMMQQTDFEFELIIGEDCSQDKTREICFEYQKKYPDKIRVLWWHENVFNLGGNGRRVFARCRGEFIAFCEGDDYWTDPLKLQKQVNLIRQTNAVMCVANSEWHCPNGTIELSTYATDRILLSLDDMLKHYFHTTTYLLRRETYQQCLKQYPEFIYWYDCVITHCMATMGPICYLTDVVSVYNWTGAGMSGSPNSAKQILLLLGQYVQFIRCSIPEVANAYYAKARRSFPKACTARTAKGYIFSLQECIRIIRVIQSLAYRYEGFFGGCRMSLKCTGRLLKRGIRQLFRSIKKRLVLLCYI